MTYPYTKIWKTAVLSLSLGLTVFSASAQMKFGGNNESRGDAILELSHTKKGLLLPRINAAALAAPPLDTAAPGMIIYNLTDNSLYVRKKTGATTGSWAMLQDALSGSGNGWSFSGNNNVDPATNFLGSTNAQPLIFKTNNTEAARISSNGRIGIGTGTPNAKLHVNGSVSTNVATATGNFAMADSNSVIVMNNAAQATVTLQSAANQAGRAIEIVAYGADSVFLTGATVRSVAAGANPVGYIAPGYSLRLVSNGTDWVVSGKQRSGVPLYFATTGATRDGEVLRDYNNYLNNGSAIIQTDVLGAPLNPIPNETAWFSMMMQAVGSTYYGQFNLNDHSAYFRGGQRNNVATDVWYKFLSHPARINFAVQELGTGGINFNHTENNTIAFSTSNTQRVTISGNGTARLNAAVEYNVTTITGNHNVGATDYTIVMAANSGNAYIYLPDAATCIGRMLIIKKMTTNNFRNIRIYPADNDMVEGEGDYISYNNTGSRCWIIQAVSNNQWIIINQY